MNLILESAYTKFCLLILMVSAAQVEQNKDFLLLAQDPDLERMSLSATKIETILDILINTYSSDYDIKNNCSFLGLSSANTDQTPMFQ